MIVFQLKLLAFLSTFFSHAPTCAIGIDQLAEHMNNVIIISCLYVDSKVFRVQNKFVPDNQKQKSIEKLSTLSSRWCVNLQCTLVLQFCPMHIYYYMKLLFSMFACTKNVNLIFFSIINASSFISSSTVTWHTVPVSLCMWSSRTIMCTAVRSLKYSYKHVSRARRDRRRRFLLEISLFIFAPHCAHFIKKKSLILIPSFSIDENEYAR